MKKLLYGVFIALSVSTFQQGSGHELSRVALTPSIEKSVDVKKKIMIMTCKGGGAHLSAESALKQYLEADYDVVSVNPQEEILFSMDPVRACTFAYMNGEDLYNCFISAQMVWVTHKLCDIGLYLVDRNKKAYEDLMISYLTKNKPDLIVSVMPILNGPMANAAAAMDIPFLIVPADVDTALYVAHIKNPCSKKFRYTLCFNDEIITKKIEDSAVDVKEVIVTGFPLRKDFFEKKDVAAIRKEYGLPSDKPIIMLLMGAAGSSKTIRYLKRMAKIDKPLHIIACIGRNEKLKKRIKRIRFKKHVTTTVISFTKRISDLMAASDIFITKPGPTSVCEAIELQLPLILDNISSALRWECANLEFVTKHNLGCVVSKYGDVNKTIKDMLSDKSRLECIRKNMAQFSSVNFDRKIKEIIREMLQEAEKKHALVNDQKSL